MAAPPLSKKPKLENSILQDFKQNKRQFESLKEAYSVLNRFDRSVCLLKITNCVADCKLNFSKVVCRTTRHCEVSGSLGGSEPPDLYLFIDLFKPAMTLLEEYFEVEDYKPKSRALELALEKLLTFLKKTDEAEKAMKDSLLLGESKWAVRLCQHYLSKLAVNPSYIIDNHYQVKLNTCDCCYQSIEGQYGDTSMGNTEIWHGYLDALIGNQPIILSPEEPEVRNGSTPVEVKSQGRVVDHEEQMLAQTIVFSFLQRSKHPEYKTFLAPCIGISKRHVVFYFYDSEHDYLLESTCFDLQVPGLGIKKSTVLAMWLTLNYKYLCSGITHAIKGSGYTADFEKFGKGKMELYKNHLTFCCGPSSDPKEYYDTGDVASSWNVKRSGPLE